MLNHRHLVNRVWWLYFRSLYRTTHGAGPRHITFHPDEPNIMYCTNELANTISVYRLSYRANKQCPSLNLLQEVSTLPADVDQNADTDINADIHVSQTESFSLPQIVVNIPVWLFLRSILALMRNICTRNVGYILEGSFQEVLRYLRMESSLYVPINTRITSWYLISIRRTATSVRLGKMWRFRIQLVWRSHDFVSAENTYSI